MTDWLFSSVAAGGAIIIAIIVIAFFALSGFTLLAAKIVKVEEVTFGGALLATLFGSVAGAIVSFLLGLLFGDIPLVGPILGTIGAWLLYSYVVKRMFDTSYGKGLLLTLLASVLAGAVAVVLALILGGTSFLSCST